MLTILALVSGAYFARRVGVHNESGIVSATVDYDGIRQDCVSALSLLGSVGQVAVDFGRGSRQYFNAELQPWLERRGVTLSLPSVDLPKLPGQAS